MRYLIISDIHGSLPRLNRALEYFDKGNFDMLLILGDILNYGPRNSIPEGIDAKGIVERLNPLADRIIAIRGNCDAEVDQMLLKFPIMADYALIVDEGHKLFLTHGHVYNPEQMPPGHFDAIFYGHTHLWKLEQDNSTVVCNTGSITFPKGGNEPTIVAYDNGKITVLTLPDDNNPSGTVLKELTIK